METIEKKISLEPAKNRFIEDGVELLTLSGTSFVYDIELRTNLGEMSFLEKAIPLIKIGYSRYLLRFKNLMRQYYWYLNEFRPSCHYYKLCRRDNANKWLEIGETTGITDYYFLGELTYSGYTVGDTVCVSTIYDEAIRRYEKYENILLFYEWANDLLNNYDTTYKQVPYLTLTSFIDSEVNDNGLFSPLSEIWIPGKKYYKGDIVYYSEDGTDNSMKPYILENTEETENIEVPYDLYNAYSGSWNKIKINNKYYLSVGTYSGYFDEMTKLLYFDNPFTLIVKGNILSWYQRYDIVTCDIKTKDKFSVGDIVYISGVSEDVTFEIAGIGSAPPSIQFTRQIPQEYTTQIIAYGIYKKKAGAKHWVERNTINGIIDPTDYYYSGQTESMLLSLKRHKTSMDDYENVLPFITHYTEITLGPGDTGYIAGRVTKKRVLDDSKTECFYMPGITNITVNPNGVVSCDYLKSITFSGDTAHKTYNQANTPILCDEITKGNVLAGVSGARDKVLCDRETIDNFSVGNTVYISGVTESVRLRISEIDSRHLIITFSEDIPLRYARDILVYGFYKRGKKDFSAAIFEYYIGSEIDSSGNVIDNTGVKYIEIRKTNISYLSTKIDGHSCILPYFDITDEYYYAKDENDDLSNSGHGATIADITLANGQVGETPFSNISVFKDENLNNVQDIDEKIDVKIERGIASSFERHNSLGEINTLQDLEHYRNDFFKVSKQ